jgi:hypothetical protein
MASAAPVTDIAEGRQLKLPRFEGFTIPTARLAFTGALELKMTNQEDVDLVAALALGKEATITIAVDGHERELVLGARVTGRAHRFRKQEHSEATVGTHTITINDVREGDEEGE